MNQKNVLDALVGNPKYYKTCGAFFVCGTPLATEEGGETLIKGNGMADAKKALAESGYDGTPIVIMAPGDVVTLKAQPVVAAQLLRDAGFNVRMASGHELGDIAPAEVVLLRIPDRNPTMACWTLHRQGYRWIVAVSGSPSSQECIRLLNAGADYYIDAWLPAAELVARYNDGHRGSLRRCRLLHGGRLRFCLRPCRAADA